MEHEQPHAEFPIEVWILGGTAMRDAIVAVANQLGGPDYGNGIGQRIDSDESIMPDGNLLRELDNKYPGAAEMVMDTFNDLIRAYKQIRR